MRLLVVVLAVGSLALPAAAAAPPFVIQGDRVVGGLRIGFGTLADARARFGKPSTVRAESSNVACAASWKRIGLVADFLDFSGRACRSGVLVRATVTSRSAWRTARSLRVGDSVARLKRLYPQARLRPAPDPSPGYWLVVRRTCSEIGGFRYPGLLARVRAGRVTALVAATAPCE